MRENDSEAAAPDPAVTWDGLLTAAEPPMGATVVVYRRQTPTEVELLCLHRRSLPDDGDWAWGPPSGCRFPGEDIAMTTRCELAEETGRRANPVPVGPPAGAVETSSTSTLEVPDGTVNQLSDEHDRAVWLTPAAALALVAPEVVRRQVRSALADRGLPVPDRTGR